MKVKDALILLQRCDPENELVIRDYSRVGIGPSSVKEVYCIGEGFDWDRGKTIIYEKNPSPIKK